MIFKIADSTISGIIADSDNKNASLYKDDSQWNFERREGMLYFVARAVTADIPNGNGDGFPYNEIKKSYQTFVGKGLFMNHASNDVDKQRGKIIDAKLIDSNPNDIYVKCLVEFNAQAYPELASMIRAGHITDVSMGLVIDTDDAPQNILLEDLTTKRYKEVMVGDKVITHDGTSGEVVARGTEFFTNLEAYKIKALGINNVVISHNHRLLVLRRLARQYHNSRYKNSITKEQIEFIRLEAKKKRLEAGLSIAQTERAIPHWRYREFECGDYKTLQTKIIKRICKFFNIDFTPLMQEDETLASAKSIQKGDYLLSPIYTKVVAQDEIDINMAKLLGWYLAEGTKSTKNVIHLHLSYDENEFANEIVTLAKQIDSNSRTKINRKAPRITISIFSKKISNIIDKNVFGKAINKSLSKEILEMEPEKQLALIGSYIDGDGCMVEKSRRDKRYGMGTKNAIQISTASLYLCKQVPFMLERSGILSSYTTQFRKPAKNSIVKNDTIEHTIYIGATYVDKLRDFSHKAFKLVKNIIPKRESFIYKNYIAVPITSITKFNFTGWGYNIQIGSDENSDYKANHSYLLNSIASENCSVKYSSCSICNHKAKITSEYCDHIRFHKGGIWAGKQVYEINHEGEFIELSLVTKGADSTAKILEVLARQKGLEYQHMLHKAAADPQFIDKIADLLKDDDGCVEDEIPEEGIHSPEEVGHESDEKIPSELKLIIDRISDLLHHASQHADTIPKVFAELDFWQSRYHQLHKEAQEENFVQLFHKVASSLDEGILDEEAFFALEKFANWENELNDITKNQQKLNHPPKEIYERAGDDAFRLMHTKIKPDEMASHMQQNHGAAIEHAQTCPDCSKLFWNQLANGKNPEMFKPPKLAFLRKALDAPYVSEWVDNPINKHIRTCPTCSNHAINRGPVTQYNAPKIALLQRIAEMFLNPNELPGHYKPRNFGPGDNPSNACKCESSYIVNHKGNPVCSNCLKPKNEEQGRDWGVAAELRNLDLVLAKKLEKLPIEKVPLGTEKAIALRNKPGGAMKPKNEKLQERRDKRDKQNDFMNEW